jgi:hypothetical protein
VVQVVREQTLETLEDQAVVELIMRGLAGQLHWQRAMRDHTLQWKVLLVVVHQQIMLQVVAVALVLLEELRLQPLERGLVELEKIIYLMKVP